MARRERKEASTGDWMNTYADMVTLLLCFFVLLFSFSTVNAEKWKLLVNSLNPNAIVVNTPVLTPGDGEGEDPPIPDLSDPTEEDIKFEELFNLLSEYVEENSLQDTMNVQMVDGIVFIQFKKDVLFDGDSYVLRQSGMEILDVLGDALDGLNDLIGEIRILGHTNRIDTYAPNNVEADRFLASNRATRVLVYLQKKGIIDGRKFVSMGYGEFYPVAAHNTEEEAQKNRRVEVIIMQNDRVNQALENVYAELGIGWNRED